MLEGGLLQVQNFLFLIVELEFNGALTPVDPFLHLLHTLIEALDLITEDSLLVGKRDQVLLLRPSNDLIHSGETLLELSHQTALSL